MELEKDLSYKNNLGLIGWLWAGNYGIERYLYILHRLTGLGILLYFFLHIFVSSLKIFGPGPWEAAMGTVENPIFKFGEYLVFVAFIFHGLNGIRLVFQELGLGLGKPTPPIFPFTDSIHKYRYYVWIVIVLFFIAAAIAFFDMFIK